MKLMNLLILNDFFSPSGTEYQQMHPCLNSSEIDSLRRELKANSERAASARAKASRGLNPRVAALREARSS